MVVALLVMTCSSLSLRSSAVVVGCRVGVGRVEGLFLVCLISVYRVLVPGEFVVTASALFFSVFPLAVVSVQSLWFIGLSILAITAL